MENSKSIGRSPGACRRYLVGATLVLILLCADRASCDDRSTAGDWPQFRGWRATGVSNGPSPPVDWNAKLGTNVRWKTPIPGLGHASPIVSRGVVFIVTAVGANPNPSLKIGLYGNIASVPDENQHLWQLFCLSRATGQIVWKRTLHQGVPTIKRHTKATHANSTPATDGVHVVVSLGSEGLYCFDFCGNLLWKRDLGRLDAGYYRVPAAQWGFASSPIIYKDMAIVQCDVQKNSYIAAFRICDGSELWRIDRGDVPTWSTPTIHEGASRTQLIVNGYRHAGGYDVMTGKQIWKLSGGGDIPVPTPFVVNNLIIMSSAHGSKRPLCAIRVDATGDITPASTVSEGQFAWYKPRDGIYMQTPIAYGDFLYACRNNGILSCYEIQTGNVMYRERLGGGTAFTASPVCAGGKLYFMSEDGKVYVVQAGPMFNLIATSSMDEIIMATPAVSQGMLIIRTDKHVYGIGKQPELVLAKHQTVEPRRSLRLLEPIRDLVRAILCR